MIRMRFDKGVTDMGLRTERYGSVVAAILTLIVLIGMMSAGVGAASKAKISISAVNADSGSEVNVSVKVAGDNVGRVDAILEYDDSLLSYVSGGQSEGDNGTVQLKKAGTGEAISFSLTFRTKGNGKGKIRVDSSEVYDMDEQLMQTSVTGGSVSVTGSSAEQESQHNDDRQQGQQQAGEKDQNDDGQTDDPGGQTAQDQEVSDTDGDSEKEGSDVMLYVGIGLMALGAIGLMIYFLNRKKVRK